MRFSFLFIIFLSLNSQGQNKELSVLTCGPGTELYSTFGHSAFRLKDPSRGIDRVYNYGMFDFRTEGFYLKFVQGKLPYMLGAYDYSHFYRSYSQEGRWIKEQKLDLTQEELNQIVSFLNHNATGDNRFYMYDFFKDNCATKIAEVLNKNLDRPVNYNFDFFNSEDTYRTLLHGKLENKAWSKFGIDLALGSLIDKDLNPQDYQFLPDYLMQSFNGSAVAGEPKTLLNEKFEEQKSLISSPYLIFLGLLILGILWTYFSLSPVYFDLPLFFTVAVIGIILMFLWFGTDHYATKMNWNILWLSPIPLIAYFRKNKFLVHLSIGLMILCLVLDIIGAQVLPEGSYFLMSLMGLRLLERTYDLSKLKRASS